MPPKTLLQKYRSKRDFSKTPEPRGQKKNRKGRLVFVVQKHQARNLHYDFRLEIGGVLKSWAVPKGPSLDPKDKRLAIPTEDHPLEYARFAGKIPKGEYGAGTVEIWDRGTYQNLQEPVSLAKCLQEGHLEVKLSGKKLKGDYVLHRIPRRDKKEAWLLIKMKD